MAYQIQRFPIEGEEIRRVMESFYAKVRAHPELGPVFANHVGTTDAQWQTHITKIEGFWRSALLRDQDAYSGNPMAVHVTAPDIEIYHFAPWLVLFEETLEEELSAESAAAWSGMAHRIAKGFTAIMARSGKEMIPAAE